MLINYTAIYNAFKDKVEVFEGLVRCTRGRRYTVDSEHHFDTISIEDTIIDMYMKGDSERPGVKAL